MRLSLIHRGDEVVVGAGRVLAAASGEWLCLAEVKSGAIAGLIGLQLYERTTRFANWGEELGVPYSDRIPSLADLYPSDTLGGAC